MPEAAAAAAPLATADTWSRRLCAAPDAGPGRRTQSEEGRHTVAVPTVRPGRHPRRAVWARVPSRACRR